MKKTIFFIFLMCTFATALFLSVSLKRNEIVVYELNINAGDLLLENFIIVSTNNSVYMPGGRIARKTSIHDIRDIGVSIVSGDKIIFTSAFQFGHLELQTDENDMFIDDFGINKNENVAVTVTYSADGNQREFYELINLKEITRHRAEM